MGKTPDEIRDEIEQTREEMGETASAIGYKADVKTRAKEAVSDKKDAIVSKVTGAMPSMPDTDGVKHGAKKSVSVAKANPLGLAIGGVAVGFLVGMLIPSTSIENEKLGEMADEVKDKAKQTGQEALDRGKQVAQEAGQAAAQTAREEGSEQGQELTSTLKENVQSVASSSSSSSA
jgi:gas vesicle protein